MRIYPETFSRAVTLSGAYVELEFADQKRYIPDINSEAKYQRRIFGNVETIRQRNIDPRFCVEELLRGGKSLPEIYFACGEQDFMIVQNRKLHRFLEDMQIPRLYAEGEGAHDWFYWNKHLTAVMDWLDQK